MPPDRTRRRPTTRGRPPEPRSSGDDSPPTKAQNQDDRTGRSGDGDGSFPHLLPARRRPPADFEELNLACWLQGVAWRDFLNLAATLELVGEMMVGADAPEWVVDKLTQWRDALDRDALFDLAEGLRVEAAEVWSLVRSGRERLRRNERGAA